MRNPFDNRIAGDAWGLPEADVGDIGRQAFETCCQAIAATVDNQRTVGVVIHGAAGAGKTHLMRRLRAYLAANPDERLRDILFVYVRLSTTANMIWRHLRRRIADDFMRPGVNASLQLESLAYHLMAAPQSRGHLLDRFKRELPAGNPWNERRFARALAVVMHRLSEHDRSSREFFEHLEGEEGLPPGLVQALRRLLQGQHLGLVRAWLRGDSLTPADLANLGIAEDPTNETDPEYAAREMVLALSRLAGARMPMVLCFDQVEALETSPGDRSGFVAFGAAASTLHDETNNLVLISCMQSSTDPMFPQADMARLSERKALLPRLGRRDALRLIRARLEAAGLDPAWTLPPEFDTIFGAGNEASARDVLAKASELFERADRPSATPPPSLPTFLQQEWENRVDAAAGAVAYGDVEEILDQGIPALFSVSGRGRSSAAGSTRDIDFRLESQAGPIDVSLCNQRNMNSLAARLRRLKSRPAGAPRLVLVRDPRLPVSRNARATWSYLDDLSRSGARLVRPSLEAVQALEALRTLLADSRSGDLSAAGSSIGPETVQDWIKQNLPSSLSDLMDQIAGTEAAPPINPQIRDELLALIEDRCMITVEEAARQTGHDAQVVRQAVQASPDLAGLLEGPPALLYRIVPAVRA